MQTELMDPRDVMWETTQPVYRVDFWSGADGPAGLATRCEEIRVTDAVDVHEVITWAEARLPDGDTYVLYVETDRHRDHDGGPGILRLAGVDPTRADP